MSEWYRLVQTIVEEVDECIMKRNDEAFSRSFKEAYGITPSEYRCNPVPIVLRTIIKPFDCYLISIR